MKPVSENTYGLERLAMFIQGIDNIRLKWVTVYVRRRLPATRSSSPAIISKNRSREAVYPFDMYESEAERSLTLDLVLPGYDYILKCSHVFNLLDARGAISVSERTRFIARVRALARKAAVGYLASREKLGFPLLKRGWN